MRLLVIGLGEGTKMFSYLNDDRKTYIATLKLGEKTDTGDKTGKLIERMSFNNLSNEKIIDVLNSFKGIQLQIPPSYSAKHIDGKRAYDLAREGKKVVLKPQKRRDGDRGEKGNCKAWQCKAVRCLYGKSGCKDKEKGTEQ